MKPGRSASCPRCGAPTFRATLRDMPAARLELDLDPVLPEEEVVFLLTPAPPGKKNGQVYRAPPLYRPHECDPLEFDDDEAPGDDEGES